MQSRSTVPGVARLCLLLAFGPWSPLAAQAPDPSRTMTLDDLAKLTNVSGAQISPDGKSIVIIVSRPDYDENRQQSELVLVAVDGGARRVLTHDRRGLGSPRWSPSGDRLAFLADAAPRPRKSAGAGTSRPSHGGPPVRQVFVMPMNGGDPMQITDTAEGVQQFAWKPDGAVIGYVTEDEPADEDARKKGLDEFEVGNQDYLATAAAQPSHIWLVSAQGGECRRLTSGTWSLPASEPPGPPASPISWSPDGKSIAFVRQERPAFGDSDLTSVQVIDVEGGSVRSLTNQKTLELFPAFSPDGSQISFWRPRDGDPNQVNEIWVVPARGGEPRSVTAALDRCVYQSRWMPDGRSILTGGNDGTRTSLWVQPVDGPARKLALGAANPSWSYWVEASVAPSGAIAFVASEPHHPVELWYMASSESPPARLTSFNDGVANLHLGKVERFEWDCPGGLRADGVLTYPPDFIPGRKYPLVLMIHGGPNAASIESFSAPAQIFAARGWVIFQPNYRGSDNRGNDFMKAIVGDAGDGPARDVVAGIDALKAKGFVDAQRIGVSGWSYGGFMTSWLIGHYDLWKAAVAGAAVTDFVDQYDLADFNVQQRYSFGGKSPYCGDACSRYREQSPIGFIAKAKAPTLVLSTTGDVRVPVIQSYRLYHALRDNGVETKFVAFPVGGHFPGDPVRSRSVVRHWMTWFTDHLGPGPGAGSESAPARERR